MIETKPRGQGRALNAYRHGLTGQVRLFTPDDEAAYKSHCDAYHQDRKPVGKLELDLTQDVASLQWRIFSCEQIENSIMGICISTPDNFNTGHPQADIALARGQAWLDRGKSMNLLSLYERRLRSSYNKALDQLDKIQENRRRAERQAEIAARAAEESARKAAALAKYQEQQRRSLTQPKLVFSASKTAVQPALAGRSD